jgi:hypothetical protein
VLEGAAREPGADSTVRQNLALAYALAGEWTEARTIASQDVPGNELDARIRDWMQLASPKKPADQVAALIGVKPVEVDHGQPIRLALRKSDTMLAEAAPVAHSPVIDTAPAPVPEVAATAPASPSEEPPLVEAVAPQPAPAVAAALPAAAPSPVATIAAAAEEVSTAAAHQVQSFVEAFMPKKAPVVHHAKPRRALAARPKLGPGDAVMQLGSYHSPQQVTEGWNRLTQRYPALRSYLPLRARFDSPNGTYWRLSVQGFSSQREAIQRCQQLKNNGGKCFVRGFAGDAPVQMASN